MNFYSCEIHHPKQDIEYFHQPRIFGHALFQSVPSPLHIQKKIFLTSITVH